MSRKVDYLAVAQLPSFKKFQTARKKFTIPITIAFFIFYLGLPILAGFTKVLTHKVAGEITWAWVYAFAQFIMTWGLCMFYLYKAKRFDKMNDDVLADIDKMDLAN
ncbi:MAG: DUF485 domain-containing protein [Propionibacteriaceae bacterium]|nr:DUF485 domain-containing protein [Propionibacteriaceae bacterium]